MNKKAIVFTRARDTLSFFVGLIVLVFGLLPLLHKFGVIDFEMPLIGSLPGSILIWVIAIFGLYILIDGFVEPPQHSLHWILIALGLLMAVFGLIPLLHQFGVIGFTIPLLDNVIYLVFISVEGLLLMIGGLTEH